MNATDAARLVERCLAVASTSRHEGERDAALGRAEVLMAKHGLAPEDYGFELDLGDEYYVRFKRYIDEGNTRRGWLPSELFDIGYSIIVSGGGCDGPRAVRARLQASRFRRWAIDTARERWRQGFYADPFTNVPMKRDAAC